MITAEIRLGGAFPAERFKDWICHRARLLDLMGWVKGEGAGQLSIVVQGPQALIDAMEMACSLGPIEAQIDRIEVRPIRLNEELHSFREL